MSFEETELEIYQRAFKTTFLLTFVVVNTKKVKNKDKNHLIIINQS